MKYSNGIIKLLEKIRRLEDILDKPADLIVIKAFLFAALLDDRSEVRSFAITRLDNQVGGILRKAYIKDQQIYAGFRNEAGGLNLFYVCELPKEYQNRSITAYHFDLDGN